MPPRVRFSGPVLGSPDPIRLAEFYERLMGWPIVEREGDAPGEEGWAKIRSEEAGIKFEFQYEPFHRRAVWPPVEGEQQMQIHLDIGVPDLAEGVARALAAGASEAAHQPQEDVRVMLDPDGHVFCLFRDAPA
jgi:catechol 2,3-dioxygenase-like lactoylglutathione lyase family enzyme